MEEKISKPIITLIKDGPIRISGNYTISDDANTHIDSGKEVFLCRCGRSANQPYCDGSHKTAPQANSDNKESCD